MTEVMAEAGNPWHFRGTREAKSAPCGVPFSWPHRFTDRLAQVTCNACQQLAFRSTATDALEPRMTDPTPAEALKACPNPWCASHRAPVVPFTAEDIWHRDGRYRVQCPDCPIKGPHAANETEAIAAWNTRALPSPATDAREDVAAYIRSLSPEHLAAMMRAAAGRQDYPGGDAGEVCSWREGVEAAAKVCDARAAEWRKSINGSTVGNALNASRIAIDFEDVAAAIRGLA